MHSKFIRFKQDVSAFTLPKTFTFPFYYTPHKLANLACEELKMYLKTTSDFDHNFGLELSNTSTKEVIGKMFGVLVVRNKNGEVGYISGFSGKLANSNAHKMFVPPVFDLLEKNSFFLEEEGHINQINRDIEAIEENESYNDLLEQREELEKHFKQEVGHLKEVSSKAKKIRKRKRNDALGVLSEADFGQLLFELGEESKAYKIKIKYLEKEWADKLEELEHQIQIFESKRSSLKAERKQRSNQLQKNVFKSYSFLNANLEEKSLFDIFAVNNQLPPAGAGECAAPKLLQYAFLNQLEPIALAEFWWGESPKSEIRKHGLYYPSCKGKCEPILNHMLEGLDVDENPLLINQASQLVLDIIFEDQDIIIVNKPAELLSVPGIHIKDSVFERISKLYPEIDSPLIIHRLDMSTSGLLVLAKTKTAHKFIQNQFIRRTVKKRYIALLDGLVSKSEGEIKLPLRVDLEDRPRQLVCYKHGKMGVTKWEKLTEEKGRTRVAFYPLTGRTHQLRVHSAHHLGLGFPIVGDDLYGEKEKRLCLHAEYIQFIHPRHKETVEFRIDPEF
ncbi:MAG: RluA family pseudouridine synthase [Flavobacteriales bacterium]